MKINWKVRFKNKAFWVTFIPTLVAFVYTVLSMIDITPAISENSIVTLLQMIITGLASLGVLVDPTTVGLDDSEKALTYDEPNR